MKLKGMKWAGHVAHIEETKFLSGNMEERDQLEDLGINMRIILKCFQVRTFWVLTPGSVAGRYQCFGGPCYLCLRVEGRSSKVCCR
jgi:hypothetical protein